MRLPFQVTYKQAAGVNVRTWLDENIGAYNKDWWLEKEDDFERFINIPDELKAMLYIMRWA
jgi:hypothetical protein